MTDTPKPVYKDPNSDKTWSPGGVGRKPRFVMDMIAAGTIIEPPKSSAYVKVADRVAVEEDPTTVKYFRYVGLRDEAGDDYTKYSTVSCRCIVGVIGDASNAIFTLNKTFKNEVSLSEFSAAWKRIDNDKVFLNNRVGVFTNDGKSTEWIERPIINKGRL
jgi:hypothetical protein